MTTPGRPRPRDDDRRLLALRVADVAERVLPRFEAVDVGVRRPEPP